MSDKIFITWDEYLQSVDRVASRIEALNINFDSIIAITRGGLIPATIFSHKFGIKNVFSFGMRSYSDQHNQQVLDIYQGLDGIDKNKLQGNILICEDIVDTGKTFDYLNKYFKESLPESNVIFTSITTKEYIPDFLKIYDLKFRNSDWVVFPYEKQD